MSSLLFLIIAIILAYISWSAKVHAGDEGGQGRTFKKPGLPVSLPGRKSASESAAVFSRKAGKAAEQEAAEEFPQRIRHAGAPARRVFAHLEDREHDWLAMQLKEEEKISRRLVESDMLLLKKEHQAQHKQIHEG